MARGNHTSPAELEVEFIDIEPNRQFHYISSKTLTDFYVTCLYGVWDGRAEEQKSTKVRDVHLHRWDVGEPGAGSASHSCSRSFSALQNQRSMVLE